MNNNSTDKNNPTIIYECSIPRNTDAAERAGFVYLLNRIQKLEKNRDDENEPRLEHSASATPLWLKYSLSIQEASDYFGIGIGRLRHIICVNPNADFVLEIGAHVRIKRQLFEQYLNRAGTV